jgi:hypothetical protein
VVPFLWKNDGNNSNNNNNHTATKIHGVAIWALASNDREVGYHVDYAEWIRYDQNVLVVPLWAGTLQCTRHAMTGGEFAVNLNGIQHYQQHGYKGNLSGDCMGGWCRPRRRPDARKNDGKNDDDDDDNDDDDDDDNVVWDRETKWVTIPYRYNRMIGHSGHLPHLSAPFSCPHGPRVIIGFNVFRMDVGPLVQQAPEHSHAFRRRVACRRQLSQLLLHHENKHNKTTMTLAQIRQHKSLTKLLVLAKRENVKQAWRDAQHVLDRELEQSVKTGKEDGTSVQALMNRLAQTEDGVWPSAVDVQVHIQRRVKDGIYACNHAEVTPESIIYKN